MNNEEMEIINVGVARVICVITFIFNSMCAGIFLLFFIAALSSESQGIRVIPLAFIILYVWQYLELVSHRYIITNKNIIHRYGIIMKDTEEIRLAKIEKVNIKKTGILEFLTGCGTLEITGTGTSAVKFSKLDNPDKIKSIIQSEIEKYEMEQRQR